MSISCPTNTNLPRPQPGYWRGEGGRIMSISNSNSNSPYLQEIQPVAYFGRTSFTLTGMFNRSDLLFLILFFFTSLLLGSATVLPIMRKSENSMFCFVVEKRLMSVREYLYCRYIVACVPPTSWEWWTGQLGVEYSSWERSSLQDHSNFLLTISAFICCRCNFDGINNPFKNPT